MPSKRHRSRARLIAPAALLVFVAAVALIVLDSSSSDDKGKGKAAPAGQKAATTTSQGQPPKRAVKKTTYTVQPGDTLGRISEKTQIEVETLQLLNPSLDPQALISGQKIKLRR
jgi:LysM repeat protein